MTDLGDSRERSPVSSGEETLERSQTADTVATVLAGIHGSHESLPDVKVKSKEDSKVPPALQTPASSPRQGDDDPDALLTQLRNRVITGVESPAPWENPSPAVSVRVASPAGSRPPGTYQSALSSTPLIHPSPARREPVPHLATGNRESPALRSPRGLGPALSGASPRGFGSSAKSSPRGPSAPPPCTVPAPIFSGGGKDARSLQDDAARIISQYQSTMERIHKEETARVAEFLSQPAALGALKQQAESVGAPSDEDAIVEALVTLSQNRLRDRVESQLRLTPR